VWQNQSGIISGTGVHLSEIINSADLFGGGNSRAHVSKFSAKGSVKESPHRQLSVMANVRSLRLISRPSAIEKSAPRGVGF
jgi:hypothetical protein